MTRKIALELKALDAYRAQLVFMESCGGDLNGYLANYGAKSDPLHYGEGGQEIYEADLEELQRLLEEFIKVSMRRYK